MVPTPSTTPASSWLYDLVLNVFSPSIDIFFREVQVRGAWRVPVDGAVILVAAPHANQVRLNRRLEPDRLLTPFTVC